MQIGRKRFVVVALRQATEHLSYWEGALKDFVALGPSKRKGSAPYYHWRQVNGKGFTIWVSQTGYSQQEHCNIVRIEMSPFDSSHGMPVFDGIVALSLAEFHSNVVVDRGAC